ncbi:hypothetical protein SDRG_05799 [Saprolegnia diclina VS20]|uniref:Intraflagellar transport protein 43 n=1 Tax=Saprolegnia diclina (strain VS20) TaxID=1156394 RepID=T0RWT6_SAPDV|nr:hypothetical protein SDRG_05799 [Saprolegnia diclina VS20]EQC36978.1 hypothetical protein SDRG_05799 [Saprolegnia diclina VS20]|eukprot:XP_008609759.1 hypothetical protein SDRG_05799 [Saprolegnia diclina VS20]
MGDAEAKGTRSRRMSKHTADDKEANDMDLHMQDVNADDKPVITKRMSGWGVEGGEAAASTASGEQEPSETKRGRRRKDEKQGEASKPKNRHFDDDGETTELVEIPDLEEEEREPDITTQIAEAPRNTARIVQSLKELERDVKYALPSTGSIDLQLLTSFLCPQRAVIEEDEAWDFDSLLRDVFQEVQKELEEKENQDELDGNGGITAAAN